MTLREQIVRYLREACGTEPEFLWAKYPNYAVFRRPDSRKWYAVLLDVPRSRLGLDGEERIDLLDVKCSPLLLGSLLLEPGFLPAYHMNKSRWISILLDGTVPMDQIAPLLEWSWDSAAPKRRRQGKGDPSRTDT